MFKGRYLLIYSVLTRDELNFDIELDKNNVAKKFHFLVNMKWEDFLSIKQHILLLNKFRGDKLHYLVKPSVEVPCEKKIGIF
jgi:hypothetical protein